jgi:DNA-binding GntR family transcriptional regulator
MDMNIIDPDNPIPKYLQISGWIKDLIQTGRYERGGILPSEVELARICQRGPLYIHLSTIDKNMDT